MATKLFEPEAKPFRANLGVPGNQEEEGRLYEVFFICHLRSIQLKCQRFLEQHRDQTGHQTVLERTSEPVTAEQAPSMSDGFIEKET